MNWHLQVCEREWVEWWYGPLPAGARGHIEPAVTYGMGLEIPFALPLHREGSGLKPPQEIRRVTSWGWRVRTNDGMHDNHWSLADSREDCIEKARAYLTRDPRDLPIQLALDDVREYRTGLW